MNIFVNRQIVDGPWGGGNKFVKALFDNAPKFDHEVTNGLTPDVEVIHIQDVHSDALGLNAEACLRFRETNPYVKIVHRVNDMDLGRYDSVPWREKAYLQYSPLFDATVFVSEWTRDYFMNKGWDCENTCVISNGVDRDIFKPREKLDNNKINIVTHHWSTNSGKGFEIYEKIDNFVKENSDFTFTYIGRERGTFKNTNVVSPMSGHALGEELAKYNLYISASEYENCPNHILESLACEIPTYACALGGASVEIVGDDHVFNNWKELEKIILSKDYIKNAYAPKSWGECMKEYFEFYEKIADGE